MNDVKLQQKRINSYKVNYIIHTSVTQHAYLQHVKIHNTITIQEKLHVIRNKSPSFLSTLVPFFPFYYPE